MTREPVTVKELVEFIWKNKRGRAFCKHVSINDVIHEVCQAVSQNCVSYTLDETTGEVVGVVTGSLLPELQVFYVMNVLTTRRGVLNTLLKKFRELYPQYKLEARRHKSIKRYNTERLLMKVNNLTLKGVI